MYKEGKRKGGTWNLPVFHSRMGFQGHFGMRWEREECTHHVAVSAHELKLISPK